MLLLRTGVDLVEVDRLTKISPGIRSRFVARVFTNREVVDSRDLDASLLGKFAAKEAVSKALGTGIGLISWQEIEIVKGEQGEPKVELNGRALELAKNLNLTQWSISISHSQTQAVAFVVAYGEGIL